MQKDSKKQIDWTITLVPLGIVVALSVLFFFMPEQSNAISVSYTHLDVYKRQTLICFIKNSLNWFRNI